MVLKMNAIECIKKRRSIRNFIDKEVGMAQLGQILEAGTFAPSSGNLQNWFFILVTDQALKDQLATACLNQNWLAKAPVLIIVVADPGKVEREYGERGKNIYSIQNASAAIQNMLLAATELGLGSCWVSAFDELIVKRALAIPDEKTVHAIIPVGYSNERVVSPARYKLTSVVFFEQWGAKIKDMDVTLRDYSEVVRKRLKKGGEKVKKFAKKVVKNHSP